MATERSDNQVPTLLVKSNAADDATVIVWGDPATRRLLVNAALIAGTANIGDVDVLSVVTGTGATNLGKAEDAVHASGDVGVMFLAVRQDTQAALAADGDYIPLTINASGELRVTGGGTQYAEDTIHVSGDTGTLALVVRNDAGTALSADGDRTVLTVNSAGALYVTGGGGGTQYAVDTALGATPTGTLAIAIRDDALSALTPIEGDAVGLRVDANGALWTRDDILDATVETGRIAVNTISGQVGVQGGSGVVTALSQRVVLATDIGLPAGTNNIGDVDILTIAAGDNNIGNVDIVTMPAIDTELPAAVALADAASATPTTPTVGSIPLLMNATTVDRQRAVVNALDSTGTGIAAAGLVGQLDDTATGTVTENQFSTVRISTRRALLIEGVASGTNVNVAVNAALPTGSNVIGALSANQSVNVAQINGITPLMGNGVTGTGSQRVTIASDNTAFTVNIGTFPDNEPFNISQIGGTTIVTGGTAGTQGVAGIQAHDAALSGNNPTLIAAASEDVQTTAPGNRVSAEADLTRLAANRDGALYVLPYGPQYWDYHENSSSALTDATVEAAPGAGLSLYVTDIVVSTGAATAMNVFFEEGASTVLGPYYLEAVAGRGLHIQFQTPKKITANTVLTITTSAAIAHGIDVTGYVAPG